MKIKTYFVDIVNNNSLPRAFKSLDEKIMEELGENTKIYSVRDTFYPSTSPSFNHYIARVVIYDDKNKKADKYFKEIINLDYPNKDGS